MAELREIQLVELSILKEIDRVCRENNIFYSLAFGSMLGAVRHKGFIPWDDDADVFVMEKDAKDLGRLIDKNKFFFQSIATEPKSPFNFYKIRRIGTLMEEEALKGLQIHQGIWVDVFTLLPAGRTEAAKRIQFFLANARHSCRCRYCQQKGKRKKARSFLLRSMPNWLFQALDKILSLMMSMLGSKKSEQLFCPWDGTYEQSFLKKEWMQKTKSYRFEDTALSGMEAYDSYLSFRFGSDYMSPQKYGHAIHYSDVLIDESIISTL